MTYPQLRIKFNDGASIPAPLDGETNPPINRATYYPNRWEVIENEVLILVWELADVETDTYAVHPARDTDETHRLYIPMDNLQYWSASN